MVVLWQKEKSQVTTAAPKFRPGQVVYMASSAEVGSIDALKIESFRYSPEYQQYVYKFKNDPRPPSVMTVGDRMDLRTRTEFELLERELATFCELVDTQIAMLQRRIRAAQTKYNNRCGSAAPEPEEREEGAPRFSVDDFAYLRESAAVVGALETVVISRMRFDNLTNQYLYKYKLGDSGRESPVEVPETDLATLCEVLPLQIEVLNKKLAEAQDKKSRACGGTDA